MYQFYFDKVVIQPTTRCNLNCNYCYLPDRDKTKNVTQETLRNLAYSIGNSTFSKNCVTLIWHGSEPLTVGLQQLKAMFEPFSDLVQQNKVKHYIQTNGTLINHRWIDLFEENRVLLGLSIDGNREMTKQRVDWRGEEVFHNIMRGIGFLQDRDYPFSAICVVSKSNISSANEIYNFFADNKIKRVGFNIEENEGINSKREVPTKEESQQFWNQLYLAWLKNPSVSVREIERTLKSLKKFSNSAYSLDNFRDRGIDIFPIINHKGDIFLLSPEFNGAKSDKYQDFIVGNINISNIDIVLKDASNFLYVSEFVQGTNNCYEQCPYFLYCGGGQASNRFSEFESLKKNETIYCKNSRQALIDGIIKGLSE